MKSTDNNTFRSDTEFRKDLIRIFKKTFEEKLPDFLEYCVHTNNASPIMEIFYIMTMNRFNKE